MHRFVVSSVAVSSLTASICLFEPSSNRLFEPASNRIFERVFERGASEREACEREVSERLRYPIPWAGRLDNTFWTSVPIDFCRAFWSTILNVYPIWAWSDLTQTRPDQLRRPRCTNASSARSRVLRFWALRHQTQISNSFSNGFSNARTLNVRYLTESDASERLR